MHRLAEFSFTLVVLLLACYSSVMADSNSSDMTQKDVCPNSCRLIMSYNDYEHCQCSPTEGNEPCQYGCQTIECRCPGRPWKRCQVWCAGYSVWHGCDCSRTWDLSPLQESTTASPKQQSTVTYNALAQNVWQPQTQHLPTTTMQSAYSGHGTSPVAIGSIVGTLVVVLILVAVMTAYVQRRFICQKRQSGIAQLRIFNSSIPLIEAVRSVRATNDGGHHSEPGGHNRRFVNPAPTPSAPPSYEDTLRQSSTINTRSQAPDYVENPPPYSSIESHNAPPDRNVSESAV